MRHTDFDQSRVIVANKTFCAPFMYVVLILVLEKRYSYLTRRPPPPPPTQIESVLFVSGRISV